MKLNDVIDAKTMAREILEMKDGDLIGYDNLKKTIRNLSVLVLLLAEHILMLSDREDDLK